jgi:23S rRNA (guanine2445-N2)-methyltransferase / 23S rRNA (guanine2069-N7)-methyltransferase
VSAATLKFLASAPRGFADLLARELADLGALQPRERAGGVAFSGSLECAYRACLWSRIANRVFLEVTRFHAANAAEFYAAVRAVDWTVHIGAGATLACDFSGRHPAITHTHFGALKLKDGIVDALRAATGGRPDIDPERPQVRVHAHAHQNEVTLSIDLSGDSLHRRGYRGSAGEAPLKENVAAGVLLRAGWAEIFGRGGPLLDPLCGSGTFCIEAAMIGADRAPGMMREYFGFLGWRGHDAGLWERLCAEAAARAQAGNMRPAYVFGSDRDPHAVRGAQENARRAGLTAQVHFAVGALAAAAPPDNIPTAGLVCTNPPYGIRLEEREGARLVHRELGEVLRERFQGWEAAVLTGAPDLGKELGLRAQRTHAVWNGGIECRLLRIRISAESARTPGTLGRGLMHLKDTAGARMFGNRLAKNLKRLGSWARRSDVSCWRIYDADMPEYAFAIDRYQTVDPEAAWLHVQEYAAPAEIELESARRRRGEVLATLPEVTGVAPERIRLRTRQRTRHGTQYEKLDTQQHFHTVLEGGLRFRVNFEDYLDTGLFLDHRITRARLREQAAGKHFLNLFGYTGTATVYAAAGGARSTTTVDLSRTYLEWARSNLSLNALDGTTHVWVQADCRAWLAQAEQAAARFDLIFLDPPTFSNSRRMRGVLDVQRDHAELIAACVRLLARGGMVVFSTNAQRFRIDESLGGAYDVRDVSAATLPKDFARNPRIHRCYELRPRG